MKMSIILVLHLSCIFDARMFPLFEYTKFLRPVRESSFIIRMAIRPPVDPFRIYKIGPHHGTTFPVKRSFQEGERERGAWPRVTLVWSVRRTGILFALHSTSCFFRFHPFSSTFIHQVLGLFQITKEWFQTLKPISELNLQHLVIQPNPTHL